MQIKLDCDIFYVLPRNEHISKTSMLCSRYVDYVDTRCLEGSTNEPFYSKMEKRLKIMSPNFVGSAVHNQGQGLWKN